MEYKKEIALEVQVQEQLIKMMIKKELKSFKIYQSLMNILQFISIVLLAIQIIRREVMLRDLQTQLDNLRQLLSRF